MPKTWKAAGPLTIGHSCLEETSRSSPARCTRIGPPKFRPQAVQKPDDICYIQNGVASNVNNPMINWLVVSTPLKNMSSSVGMIIPNIWKVKKKNVLTCSKAPISQWSTFIDHQMVDSNPLCFMVPPKHGTSADLFFSLVAPSKSLLEFTSLHSPLCWSKFRKWSIAIAIAIHR